MSKSNDLKVLHTLYDNLFDAITYAPPSSGQQAAFKAPESMIQFASYQAINSADFDSAFSPLSPNGNLKSAEVFSRMVDDIPLPQLTWQASGSTVSAIYKEIANANSEVQTSDAQKKQYDLAYNYLNVTKTITDFTGAETTQTLPSAIYTQYQKNMQTYAAALSTYRLTYNNYNLDDPKDQKAWVAQQPVLQNAVDNAWSDMMAQGGNLVIQALQVLGTSINSAVRDAITQAQKTLQSSALASSTGGAPWYLAYALPSDWAAAQAGQGLTGLAINSSNLNSTSSSSFDKWSTNLSAGWGLWSGSGGASGGSESSNSHMDASKFSMTAKIGLVRIYRPWFNPSLLQMLNWSLDSVKAGGIGDGHGSNGQMPMYTTALIIAREFTLTGEFSSEDKSKITKSVEGTASAGWGPFQISGSYAHGSSQESLNSTFNGSTLSVPGIQIIGYVNTFTPYCPPDNSNGVAKFIIQG